LLYQALKEGAIFGDDLYGAGHGGLVGDMVAIVRKDCVGEGYFDLVGDGLVFIGCGEEVLVAYFGGVEAVFFVGIGFEFDEGFLA
jgi:hypothetical protein